jgi:methionyl-tRNA formyltransferase
LGAGHEVPLVVTQPDRPIKRSSAPAPPAVKRFAIERGLSVEQPQTVKGDALRSAIEAMLPDVLVVVAYGRILPQDILRAAPLGAVNAHFSLLPKYRGAAPVQWALARGETVTGVTTMLMNERMDEGDVLLARALPIEPGEHAPALAERLAEAGAALLVETLSCLGSGRVVARPQDHAAASYAPRLSRRDGEIDLGLSASEVENRIRGAGARPACAWSRRAASRARPAAQRPAPCSKPRPRASSSPAGPRPGCSSCGCNPKAGA